MNRDTNVHRGVFCAALLMVAIVSLIMRLPSCQESYWLDELHSAWAVDDDFTVVAERAAAGNQTTGYFHSLWVWHALVGSDELRMRLSSVIASTLAAVLLVVGVTLQTRRVAAGVIAGGILALDPNAIFFGCELRPYSAVMLCAVLATWATMTWLDGDVLGRSVRGARWRLAALFWICVAALLHPTSLGVLFWMVPLASALAWYRGRLTLWRADGIAGMVVLTTLGLLAASSLPQSWQHREQWKAFGQVTRPVALWYAWSWVPIAFIPLACGMVNWLIVLSARKTSERSWAGLLPMLVGVTGTCVFFVASYCEIVPLWHRRYFVTALPLLAWSAGVASTFALPQSRLANRLSGSTAVGVLLSLCWFSGHLGSIHCRPDSKAAPRRGLACSGAVGQ